MALSSSLFLALAATVLMHCTVPVAVAQNSPSDWVSLHNAARRSVGVGPVTWDNTVAAYAESYARRRSGDCQLVHSGTTQYGENLFGGWGREWSAADAVKSWVDEKQYYNYMSNTCASGRDCGHYTQVVWRSSTRIGCARVKCSNGRIFIICNYSPPGNVSGQRPY